MSRRSPGAVLAAALVVAALVGAGALVVDRVVGPASDGPPTETVVVAAPRGRILDRSGKVLVEEGTVLQVRADVAALEELAPERRATLLEELAGIVAAERIARIGAAPGVLTGQPITAEVLAERLAGEDATVVLAARIGDAVRQAIEGDPERFPGLTVEPVGARTYPYGALAAQLLGYVGRISQDEVEVFDLPEDSLVGKAGIERAMDQDLRGRPGRIVYELDEDGQRVRELVDRREEPEPGRDVHLTLDVNLQYLVEQGLTAEVERRRGVLDDGCFLPGGCSPAGAASVAVDPRDGAVLAMASYPTYDPLLFADGISTADYEAIAAEERGEDHGYPLLNRAIAGQYAPGSTVKPFTAHAGLAAGLITPDEVFNDTGTYAYSADCDLGVENNCSATNAGATPHGPVDLADALRVSSDTYFYALGDQAWRSRATVGEEALQEGVEAWGFGDRTGVELVGEATGRIPTPTWLMDFSTDLNGDTAEAREAGTWTAGTNGNVAAGQGDVLVTPLQLAQGYATLANGGTILRPRLVLGTTENEAPEATGEVDLPAEWRDPIVEGLDGVTKAPGGTATTLFAGFDQSSCPVMAKTGTARVEGKNDTSLFVAVAPTPTADRPATIALATVVEGAGSGTAAAGPVARRVLEPYAASGCEITGLGEPGSPYEAPPGGRIDVAAAVAELVPPGGDPQD